jgi:PDZ domain/Aspartyl protease
MRRAASILLVSVLAVAVVTGAAAATSTTAGNPSGAAAISPEAAAILARAKEATGGAAWDAKTTLQQTVKIHTAGLDGTAGSLVDLRNGKFVDHFALGPMKGMQGFDGTTTWSQDASGQPRVEAADDARLGAVDEGYRRALAYWYPERWPARIESLGRRQDQERAFDVLRISPRDGRPFELWVDAATSLTDRIVEVGGTQTTTIHLSDYRLVDGVKLPYTQRSGTGESKYDVLTTVEQTTFNQPLPPSVFALPAPPPPDFAMPAGATSVLVPFQLLNNHIYVDVKLNGKGPFRMLCDTGGLAIVFPKLAATLGLQPVGALQGGGVGEGAEDVALVKMDSLEVGGVVLHDPLFAVLPLADFDRVEGVEQNGLIGYEIFRRFVVKVDYERSTLTLTLPSAFAYHGDGVVVPFTFNEHIPQVQGSIDGIPGTFDIDTGSRSTLDLMGPFVDQHGLHARYAPKMAGVSGWGAGGAARSEFARAQVLRLGGVEFDRPVVELSLQKKGAFADQYVAGNVGAGLLRLYNVTFDYSRQQIIFERNAHTGQPAAFDRLGAWLNLAASGGALDVVDVYAGSPAADAGLRQGDRVVAVDGTPAGDLRLPALRERLRTDTPGTRVRLTVERGGQRTEVIAVLRDLV